MIITLSALILVRVNPNSKKQENPALDIQIRPFQLTDLDRIHYIEERSFPHPWTAMDFMNIHKRDPNGFLVAVRNGEVLGYVVAEIITSLGFRDFRSKRRGHLLNLAVHPEFKCKGIGTVLAKAIIAYLKEKGSEDVWLEVRRSNSIARSFYSKLGFLEKGRKLRYYFNEDAIIMTKEL